MGHGAPERHTIARGLLKLTRASLSIVTVSRVSAFGRTFRACRPADRVEYPYLEGRVGLGAGADREARGLAERFDLPP